MVAAIVPVIIVPVASYILGTAIGQLSQVAVNLCTGEHKSPWLEIIPITDMSDVCSKRIHAAKSMLRAAYAIDATASQCADLSIVRFLGAYTEGPSRRRKRRLYISAVRYRSIELCNAVSATNANVPAGYQKVSCPYAADCVKYHITSCYGVGPPILAASGVGAFGPNVAGFFALLC